MDDTTALPLDPLDPLALASALIARPSVTPHEAGALDLLEAILTPMGFVCQRLVFEDVDNLYARRGDRGLNLCFAGHTDVVPPGDEARWTSPPFTPTVRQGRLYGRGAADMKGAIAAFISAVARQIEMPDGLPGSVSLLITGDEEGPAVNGTVKVLEALAEAGEHIDHCLVGEPTSHTHVGDVVKVGRRGSLNGVVRVIGRQGHVAYPERADNPIPPLLEFLARLMARPLDAGAPHFQASNLEITTIDVANPAHNVIPGEARAKFNIRFNTAQDPRKLETWIQAERASVDMDWPGDILVDTVVTGDAFLTDNPAFLEVLRAGVADVTGRPPAFTTGGGTSDARFIKNYAPVAELGLVGATMHQVDENVPVADIERLTGIYAAVLARYFSPDQDEPGEPAA